MCFRFYAHVLALLQLNSGPVTEKLHDTLIWKEGSNGPVILGAHIDPTAYERTQQGFKGVISSLTVSGEAVPLGKAVRPQHMQSFDSCPRHRCLHSSRCRNSNTLKARFGMSRESRFGRVENTNFTVLADGRDICLRTGK
ncbi:hypothetical protein ANCCAN_25074 [Ancylostoma caninum]|uniref:Uncharacterized protein n=1 Tax=Ancylostoma caninum TaxID=29170 RepID=A0A368FE66_ANCCA|nr:hypothetical protein ANCCAN_25074 [Ancylostoma caninum]